MQMRDDSRKKRAFLRPRYLGVVFVLAVIVPSILLAVLSIRAAGREEAYIEKQLHTALLVEVTYTASLADAEVKKIAEELKAGLDAEAPVSRLPAAFSKWKQSVRLVGVPFLLSPRYDILWPRLDGKLDPAERAFLEENAAFLGNKASTTLFRNIALVYRDEILEESQKLEEKTRSQEKAAPAAASPAIVPAAPTGQSKALARIDAVTASAEASEKRAHPLDATAQSSGKAAQAAPAEQPRAGESVAPFADVAPLKEIESGRASAPRKTPAPAAGTMAKTADFSAEADAAPRPSAKDAEQEMKKGPSETSSLEAQANQAAIESFAQSETIRKEVYKQAREKGDTLGTRNVVPAAKMNEPSPQEERQSLLVAEQGTFGQIAERSEFGIIPRFISDRLTFLFWEKQADGRIAGCRIEDAVFRSRVASVVAPSYTDARIMAILDERGEPLAAPSSSAGRDWRRPFVSLEIGESLPRWETASYLTDPGKIASQARATSLAIWILVLVLFVSVASGGTLVLGSLSSELRLARNKTTFVTNVSHELKTPLTSISLFAELLRKGKGPGQEKTRQYLAQISSETERLTRLVNNVLDFSTMEKGKKRYRKKSVNAVEAGREILESQRTRLENLGFSVDFRAAEEGIWVEADAEALKQVVLNLLSNAEKYSPDRKAIEVEASREGDWAVIHVRDRGMGVPEKHRERIFQEFFRVDDSLTTRVKGTGLGLTIARRIARDHGGDVTCGPRAGGGSDFAVRLPAGSGAGEEAKR